MTVGTSDKISNKVHDPAGKAKEGTGKATGDKSTENEGKVDQAKSSLKDAGEKIKDAFKEDPKPYPAGIWPAVCWLVAADQFLKCCNICLCR